jgi:formylglycine-generating enzyme required for sulfatase activity
VGSFAANRYGLYDMSGNVWQWCEDSLSEDEQKRDRMLRGGSWLSFDPLLLRCTYRNLAHSEDRREDEGFRCVLVVSGS